MVHPFSLSRFKELLCIGNRTRLTNDGNLHLAWISHLILDFCGNLVTQSDTLFIVHLVVTDNHTKLAASLNRFLLLPDNSLQWPQDRSDA